MITRTRVSLPDTALLSKSTLDSSMIRFYQNEMSVKDLVSETGKHFKFKDKVPNRPASMDGMFLG